MSAEQASIRTPYQIQDQVDHYIANQSAHLKGRLEQQDYTMNSPATKHMPQGVAKRASHQGSDIAHSLEVQGMVSDEELYAKVVTHSVGYNEPHRVEAQTSDGTATYHSNSDERSVTRHTENGEYVHTFKDPAKAKRAGELITSLASKRADKILARKTTNPEQKAA